MLRRGDECLQSPARLQKRGGPPKDRYGPSSLVAILSQNRCCTGSDDRREPFLQSAAQPMKFCYPVDPSSMLRSIMLISRVMIIGGPGSGKTWLGTQMRCQLDLPVYSIDEAVWDCHGNLRSETTIDTLVREQISKERWIIEGGNTRTYEDRALRSQLIIRLNPPLWLRFIRVLRRDGPKFPLLFWTLRYDKVFGEKDRALLRSAKDNATCIEIRSGSDCKALLSKLVAK